MSGRSLDGLGEFVADRLFEEHWSAIDRGSLRDQSGVKFSRWVLNQWISLRTEADRMRDRHNNGGVSEAYIVAAARIDAMAALYEPAIRLLAAVWDTHPDYRREWQPK